MGKITRREFIQKSSLASASITLAPGINGFFSSEALESSAMGFESLPTVPYGAVYYRKSNPTKTDWERDFRQAANDGMNCFRHWFVWSGIEVVPGKYYWDDYDRMLDLGVKYGIKTIIADIMGLAPEWAYKEFPHARWTDLQGHKAYSEYSDACAVGGYPGVCFDNEHVLKSAGNFLREMVSRYKDHPGLGGYNVWNEQNMNGSAGGCYCDGTTKKFRGWLKDKYGDLNALSEAWNRYSYRDWDDIEIPRHNQFYGDSIDWIKFRTDNAYRLMKWRVDTIKKIDPDHPVTAHQNVSRTLRDFGEHTYNCFRAADLVEGFGMSGGSNFSEGSKNRWEHWIENDLTRSAAKGKPIWVTEMPAGFAWRGPFGASMEDRTTTANDVRLFSMTSFAGGFTGVLSPRWRPLLNGWHTGNFGFYAMDGSPTDRSEMASRMAKWSNDPKQKYLWEARPIKGEIGLIVVPESQMQAYLLEGDTDHYYQAINGVYQGLLFNNIQADFIYSEDISGTYYDLLYLPYPIMLPEKVANDLKEFVENGSMLISEVCPAFWGGHGEAGTRQPNYGLDELFGALQQRYQLTADILDDMKFKVDGRKISGGLYLQTYGPTTATVAGIDSQGEPIVVDNEYGNGKCRLIGTSPGYGYPQSEYREADREFFSQLLPWAGKSQQLTCSDSRLVARIHEGDGYFVIWVINSARENVHAEMRLAGKWSRSYEDYEIVENNGQIRVDGNRIHVDISERDVAIIKFLRS
jgi:beta-galactosidase